MYMQQVLIIFYCVNHHFENMYCLHYTDGNPTRNTVLAFTASLIAITAATLSYFIDRDDDETKVVQYYLSLQCDARGNIILDELMGDLWGDDDFLDELSMEISEDAVEVDGLTPPSGLQAIPTDSEYNTLPTLVGDNTNTSNKSRNSKKNPFGLGLHSSATSRDTYRGNTVRNGITFQEKENLMLNRGRTLGLAIDIAEVFGIPTKNIEIGASMITKYGLMTHVVHFIYEKDLAEMEEGLKQLNPDKRSIYVTPRFYVQQLHQACDQEINQVFRAHFEVNNDFSVRFMSSLSKKKDLIQNAVSAEQNIENDNRTIGKKQSILNLAVSLADIAPAKEESKMGPKYARVSGENDEVADVFDITDQMEEWMKQRNLDIDNIDHRKKFLVEINFMNEQKVNDEKFKSAKSQKDDTSIYEKMMTENDDENSDDDKNGIVGPLQTQIEMQAMKNVQSIDADLIAQTERVILKAISVSTTTRGHEPIASGTINDAIWETARGMMNDMDSMMDEDNDEDMDTMDIANTMHGEH